MRSGASGTAGPMKRGAAIPAPSRMSAPRSNVCVMMRRSIIGPIAHGAGWPFGRRASALLGCGPEGLPSGKPVARALAVHAPCGDQSGRSGRSQDLRQIHLAALRKRNSREPGTSGSTCGGVAGGPPTARAPTVMVSGVLDRLVPPYVARDYARARKGKAGSVRFVDIPDARHFDLVVPVTAWEDVRRLIEAALEAP